MKTFIIETLKWCITLIVAAVGVFCVFCETEAVEALKLVVALKLVGGFCLWLTIPLCAYTKAGRKLLKDEL